MFACLPHLTDLFYVILTAAATAAGASAEQGKVSGTASIPQGMQCCCWCCWQPRCHWVVLLQVVVVVVVVAELGQKHGTAAAIASKDAAPVRLQNEPFAQGSAPAGVASADAAAASVAAAVVASRGY
jgi:hypothetical protein